MLKERNYPITYFHIFQSKGHSLALERRKWWTEIVKPDDNDGRHKGAFQSPKHAMLFPTQQLCWEHSILVKKNLVNKIWITNFVYDSWL